MCTAGGAYDSITDEGSLPEHSRYFKLPLIKTRKDLPTLRRLVLGFKSAGMLWRGEHGPAAAWSVEGAGAVIPEVQCFSSESRKVNLAKKGC